MTFIAMDSPPQPPSPAARGALAFVVLIACESPTPTPAAQTVTTASASSPAPVAAKAEQCAALIARVNQTVDESRKIDDSVGDATKQLETLGASAATAKTDIEKLPIDDPRVDQARDRYVAMLDATSKATTKVITAAREQDFDGIEKGNESLTKAVAQEEALIDGINRACGLR
jgi:hypothetical protein